MGFKQCFLVILSVMTSLVSGNTGAVELFIVAGISRVDLGIAGVEFNPKLARAGLGIFLWDGIALEFQSDIWSDEDEVLGLGIASEIPKFQAAYLRLQSPESGGYSAYVNLGYSELILESYSGLTVLEETLSSPTAILGFQKSLDSFPDLAYAISYEMMYDDNRVVMSALTFDYSYRFGSKK